MKLVDLGALKKSGRYNHLMSVEFMGWSDSSAKGSPCTEQGRCPGTPGIGTAGRVLGRGSNWAMAGGWTTVLMGEDGHQPAAVQGDC